MARESLVDGCPEGERSLSWSGGPGRARRPTGHGSGGWNRPGRSTGWNPWPGDATGAESTLAKMPRRGHARLYRAHLANRPNGNVSADPAVGIPADFVNETI